MTTVAIHQPQYLPYLGYFHKLAHCDVFVALDNVQFQKNGLQNRNKIKTGGGWQWLTVPVLHSFGQRINEVKLNVNAAWQHKHWQALMTNYASAPHFEELCGPVKEMLLDQEFHDLFSIDMALMQWAMKVLDIQTPVICSSSLDVQGNQTELLVEICKAVQAERYLSGPGGKRYLDGNAFEREGIAVTFQEFASPEYVQLLPEIGFVPDLSIVDALFNQGKQTRRLLD